MIARLTLASIRNELDTLARATGVTITIERTDKDGNETKHGRYVTAFLPSGASFTGVICATLAEARNSIRQYLAQAGIVPSTDTFSSDNLTAAVAAHHRRYLASIANDPQPEPPATTIDIASKYGTFTYQMVAWRCADRSNGLASYPTWHETLDAHEWIDCRPLTTDRIKRVVTTWPAQNIATVELDNGYWYQVRYETMPAPAHEPYEPGVFGGGSHAADTEVADAAARNRQREASNAQKMTLEAAQDAALEVGAMFGKSVRIYRTLKDGTPKSDGGWYRFEIDNAQLSVGYRNLSRLLDGLRDMVKAWQETQPTPERIPAQPKKQRTATTTQKRDNQRAQRAALNEAYKAHAAGKASEVSDILTAFGFEVASTKDVDGTPVTIWQDTNEHATIKQTPYSLRIYNGQLARLPRHGDAELINRVEHGWCACGDARGYAAGLADAILRLIEVPDPYMQALDAMEAREAEQSAPLPRPSAADLAEMYGSVDLDLTARLLQAGERDAYTIAAPGHDGRPVIIAEAAPDVSDNLPELVLHGGQPSMSGPWELPVISGGSQESDVTTLNYARGYFHYGGATAIDATETTSPRHTPERLAQDLANDGYVSITYGVKEISGKGKKRATHYLSEQAFEQAPAISGGSQESEDTPDYCGLEIGDRVEMTMSPYVGHQGFVNDLADGQAWVSFDNAKSGHRFVVEPWQLQRLNEPTPPAISGGSQDAEEITWSWHACTHCGKAVHKTRARMVDGNPYHEACCDAIECHHDADEPPARFCSQCGDDAHPEAPQPTDTGTSHDVITSGDHVIISHSPDAGTLAEGDTRPYAADLKAARFKWSRNLGAWYVPNSRDRRPVMPTIERAARLLRERGALVTLSIDDNAPDIATVEANRAERHADRQDALTHKAEKLNAKGHEYGNAADATSARFEMGQPILVGHHSEARARRDHDKLWNNVHNAAETLKASEEAAERAVSSERRERERLTAGATLRRIEKLETEIRMFRRNIEQGHTRGGYGIPFTEMIGDHETEIAYWRAHLAALEAQGVKLWGPDDFQKGDYARTWVGLTEVVRVNKKSLTVKTQYSWTQTVPWDSVKGKKTAAEIAEANA